MPLSRYPTPAADRIAEGGELAASLAALRAQLEIPSEYPADAAAEAQRAAREVPTDPEGTGLPDLRGIELLTIDPQGSTDLDQAFHLERTAGGAILHYAIADVPAYVAPGGALDAETRRRGQTLYAPDERVPLHPHIVGEGAASLLPGVDRRAFVWRFVLDEGARPTETTLTRGIVRSRRQWSYTDAQRAIEEGTAPAPLAALSWFGAARRGRERERGGASLNLPAQVIETDAAGFRIRLDAPLPVEEDNAQLSLLTGMAAAKLMLAGGVGILRTMPPAPAEAVARFRAQAGALGIPWPEDEPYGAYLARLGDAPAALAVREQAARLFRGAGYAPFDGAVPELPAPEQPVQAAIGAPYAHTTAPLRRLVDRFVLVICEAHANGTPVPTWAREALPALPETMARSGRLAGALDRGAIDRVEAAVLSTHIGEDFDAVVLSRRDDRGGIARVRLDDPPVEADARTGAAAGTRVRVRLVAASIPEGTVSFEDAPG